MMFVLFLLNCSKDDSVKKVNPDGTTTLTYWCSSNPHEMELARILVDDWNAENHTVKVHLQPIPASQSSEEVLLAAIAGGTTPDLCSNMWPGAMDEFINAGGLVRLDQFDDFFEFNLARVPGELMKTFAASDDHYYQLPWKTNPIMIMYNKTMFRDAGIDTLPRTYSELLEAGEKLTLDKDGDGQMDQWMGYRNIKPIWWQRFFDYYAFYVAASGGLSLFDGDSLIFENAASVEVFDLFRKIYKRGYFPITDMLGDKFIGEQIATSITGPYSIPHVEKFKHKGFEYDFFPIPIPDDYVGPVYTYGDHKNISIFSTTDYPAESWEFAKFLISEKADSLLLVLTSQIPIRKNLTSDPRYADYFSMNPGMIKFADQAVFTRGVDGASELKEIFDAISQEFEACAVFDARTPEESIHLAAERSQVIIDWNRAK
ncbi:MAG: extracellular solute-binding protein [Candidatus Marinimicrobia bacterium]|nr:extracellular solute-binding protein [FCB group bacterium]MBL7025088.1 extracellular solute-binding protein [Candidatus Neomarinimicrobiota bacterium]